MGLKWTRSLHLLFPSQPPIRSCSGRGWVVWCSNLTWNLWLNFPPSRGISVVLCNSLKGICDSDYCEPDSTSLFYKKGEKMKKNLPLSFCCVSDATPDLRYNDWEENKTAWIRGTCTHFCCSQQKVKGGQPPHSILMPLFFTELKSRDTFQVIIGFLTIVIYTRGFGPTECWGSPLSLSKSLSKAKARSLGSHAWFFCRPSAGSTKRSDCDLFVTVNNNDLKMRNKAAKRLKCRPLDFS